MMLGNLLGNIDALLSDNLEDSLIKINYMSEGSQVKNERLQDKRKVTFSEAIMEKTISARTSTTVSVVDLSNEIYKNIDSYICDLDNDLSITNDHSYFGESLEFEKVETLHGEELDRNSVDLKECSSVNNINVTENSVTVDQNNLNENVTVEDTAYNTSVMDDASTPKTVENDPFVEKNQSLEHEFIINSPFSKPSLDFQTQGQNEEIKPSIFGDSYVSVQEPKSTTIDDFIGLKTEMDSALNESSNFPVLDLLNEEFHSADDISEIFSQTSNDDCISRKEDANLGIIDIPSTPRSIPPVDQFMSPGQFFSQKSGKLGYLGDAKVGTDRPLWYTPKTDAAGCLLDPIDATPTESNKLLQTPRGSRLVRPPLYSSPSSRIYKESVEQIEQNNVHDESDISKGKSNYKVNQLSAQDRDEHSFESISHTSIESKKMDIDFPAVTYRSESRISIFINNPTCKDALWTVKPVGNPYLANETQNMHPVDDIIFRFIQNKGKVISGSDISLSISFFPLIFGKYSQTFHLRVKSHLIVLELSGESLRPNSERDHSRPRFSLPHGDYAFKNSQTPYQTKSDMRLIRTEPKKRIVSLKNSLNNVLDFGTVQMRSSRSLHIHVCNNLTSSSNFKMYISGQFAVPTEKLLIEGKSYVSLPIAFTPTQTGSYKGFLVIKSDMGKSEKIILTGVYQK